MKPVSIRTECVSPAMMPSVSFDGDGVVVLRSSERTYRICGSVAKGGEIGRIGA